MGKRSGGGIIALIWKKNAIKYHVIVEFFPSACYLLLVGTNKRQVYEENENKTAKRKYLW